MKFENLTIRKEENRIRPREHLMKKSAVAVLRQLRNMSEINLCHYKDFLCENLDNITSVSRENPMINQCDFFVAFKERVTVRIIILNTKEDTTVNMKDIFLEVIDMMQHTFCRYQLINKKKYELLFLPKNENVIYCDGIYRPIKTKFMHADNAFRDIEEDF